MSVPPRIVRRGLARGIPAAGAAALLLSGCGADGSSDPAPGGAERPSAVSSASSSPSVSRPAGTPGAGLPKAVDGADVAACADGSCEVRVQAGDEVRFEDRLGLDTYTVVGVGNGALWHEARDGSSRLAGSVSAPGHAQFNELTVEVIAVEGDRAVIRISI